MIKTVNHKASGSKGDVTVAPAWRFLLTIFLLGLLAVLVVWRVLSLQVLDTDRGYEFLQGQGDARTIRTEHIPAYRGSITDRNGEPLAVSTPVASVWVNPKYFIEEKSRWHDLAAKLDVSVSRIEEKVTKNRARSFVYLRRHISPEKAESIKLLKMKGVNIQREYKRFYPAAEVASHVVGFTNIDDKGQEGMELAFDKWLSGEAGSKKVLKDLHGNTFRDVEQGKVARSGKNISLSIDLRLQYLAYRELKAALQKVGAKSGSIVMLDSVTGEVLAMANQPSFNPNNRRKLDPDSLRNRAMIDMLEPGSTVKPLMMVAALESGKYSPFTKIDTNPGHIRVGSKTLVDPVNYGVIDVTKVLTKSSQVGTSKIALDLDEQSVWEVFQRFGLGLSTDSGFPGESAGLLPNRSHWRPIERATFAFGYGLAVTPLQLAQAYSVFANDGKMQGATLLRQSESQQTTQVVTPRVSHQIVTMLETVVGENGTGKSAGLDAYRVAGKTGTIHKADKGGYADDRYTAVFAGLAPASNPRLVVVVVLDEPKLKMYHGGEVAAPVFSKVVDDALRILDVAPDKRIPAQQVVEGVTRKVGGRKSV